MIKQNSNNELPNMWKFVRLGDVIDIQGGSQPPKKYFIYKPEEGYVRLLQIRDFGNKPVPTYVPKDKVTKFCAKDDIFIARYGASLGRIVTGLEGAYNVALAKVIFDKETFFSKYLFYLLQTPYFQTPIHMISRSAQNGFNKGEIFPIEIPLAPLNEQKYIVLKIEKQFSRLDKAVDNLKRVKANLKRYKASVLKAAVEGKLTEEWRKANPDVEPADKLLKRILVKRRKKWEEAELDKMKAKGKKPKNDKWKKKYKPQIAEWLYELSKTWCWASIEQLASQKQYSVSSGPFGSNLGTKDYVESGIPVLRGKNIQNGQILLKNFVYVTEAKAEEIKRSLAYPDDVVIIAVGSSGRPGIIPIELDRMVLSQNCNKITCDLNLLLPEFLNLCLQTDYIQEQISGKTTDTVRKFFSLTNFKQIFIPLPPIQEQNLILEVINKQISNIEWLEKQINIDLKHSDSLRQSILKKAFSGKLFPQEETKKPQS